MNFRRWKSDLWSVCLSLIARRKAELNQAFWASGYIKYVKNVNLLRYTLSTDREIFDTEAVIPWKIRGIIVVIETRPLWRVQKQHRSDGKEYENKIMIGEEPNRKENLTE